MDSSKKNMLLMVIFLLPGCFSQKKGWYEDSKESGPSKGQHFTDANKNEEYSTEKGKLEKKIKEFETQVLEKVNTEANAVRREIKDNFATFKEHQKKLLNKGLKDLESETARRVESWENIIENSLDLNKLASFIGQEIHEASESRESFINKIAMKIKDASEGILAELYQGFLDHFKKQQDEDFKVWKSELKAITQVDVDLLTQYLTNIRIEPGRKYTLFEASEAIDGVYLKIWNDLLSSNSLYPNIENEWTCAYSTGFRLSAKSYQEKVRTYLLGKADSYRRKLNEFRRPSAQKSNYWGFGYSYQQSSNQKPGSQRSNNKGSNGSSTGTTKPAQTVNNQWGETISSRFRSAMKYIQWEEDISSETGVRSWNTSYLLAQKYLIWKTFADTQTQHLVVMKVRDAQKGNKERPKEAYEWSSHLKYDVAKYVSKTTKALLGYLDVDWSQSQRECQANQVVKNIFLLKLASIDNNPKLQRRAEAAAIWERSGLLQNHMIVRSLIRSKQDPDGSDLKQKEPGADYTYRFLMEYFNAN